MEELVQRHPEDVALERRDALERPALGVARYEPVELVAMGQHAIHQLAGEWPGLAVHQLLDRPAGHVGLVEGEHGGPALVGPPHLRYARETYSPERVSTRTRSPAFTNSGTRTVTPDSSVAGLSPPPEAVSPFTPGSVSDTASSTALGTCTSVGRSST